MLPKYIKSVSRGVILCAFAYVKFGHRKVNTANDPAGSCNQ